MKDISDKVFLKTRNDGLWEKNPTIAFTLYLFVYLILFFGSMFVFVFNNISGWLLAIFLILLTVGFVTLSVYLNNIRNISKSTGFVKRDGVLYLIRLGYLSEINGNMIHMPSGSAAQAATLPNNIRVASQVQKAEKEVHKRRINPQAYIDVVNYKLNVSKQKNHLPKGCIEFLVLANPKVEKEDKNFIWISYDNGNDRKIRKIRNGYDGLVEEIKR